MVNPTLLERFSSAWKVLTLCLQSPIFKAPTGYSRPTEDEALELASEKVRCIFYTSRLACTNASSRAYCSRRPCLLLVLKFFYSSCLKCRLWASWTLNTLPHFRWKLSSRESLFYNNITSFIAEQHGLQKLCQKFCSWNPSEEFWDRINWECGKWERTCWWPRISGVRLQSSPE